MDRGPWWATVQRVVKSQTWLSDFPAGSDSKVSVYNAGDPGFNPCVGKIPWRRKWQSTPVLLPGKSHGQRSLVGYSPWGCKESDMTEQFHLPLLCVEEGKRRKEKKWWSLLDWQEVAKSPHSDEIQSLTATSLSILCSACVTTDFLNSITTTPICLLNTYFAQNITWDFFHVSISKHD